jgi:hypothetical protein
MNLKGENCHPEPTAKDLCPGGVAMMRVPFISQCMIGDPQAFQLEKA